MANSNFVVNAAQFTPLSFDEYYKPLAILNEQHQKLDDAYLELYTKASTVEQMANEQTDPEAYKQYKAYADDLRSAIETLNRNGLTPGSRSQMLTMARRYGDEVAPIQGAYTRRATDIEKQRELLAKDQTTRFSRKASDSSLMDYIKNPSLSYDSFSGAQITADVADKVKNLKGQILAGGVGEWSKTLGGQQFERMIRNGLTIEQVADIANNPGKYPIFDRLIDAAVESSGVNQWNSPDDYLYARQRAIQGLWEGIGTEKVESVENKDLDRALKYEQILTHRYNRLKDASGSGSGSKKGDKPEGLHYKELSNIVSRNELQRYDSWSKDRDFVEKMQKSDKKLRPKDVERLNSIASMYGVSGVDKDGNMNYNSLLNRMAQLSGKRATPLYMSNLTDASTVLTDMAHEMLSGFHPKNGEITAEDMDYLFPLENKSWKDVPLGKSNGVNKTYTDLLFDAMNAGDSRIAVDPMSGLLVVKSSSLGDITMYDKSKDNGIPKVLNKQGFSIDVAGNPMSYNFYGIMDSIYNILNYDGYSDADIRRLTGKSKSQLSREELELLDSYLPQYYNSLIESLFTGISDANNAVTMSHGKSSESANVVIPRS